MATATATKIGIIGSILEILGTATSKKPISKETIAQELANRFPDRDIEKLRATVNTQVSFGRMEREHALVLMNDRRGYWFLNGK